MKRCCLLMKLSILLDKKEKLHLYYATGSDKIHALNP